MKKTSSKQMLQSTVTIRNTSTNETSTTEWPLKKIILLHLLTVQTDGTKTERQRKNAENIYSIINLFVDRTWVEYKDGQEAPVMRYDMVNVLEEDLTITDESGEPYPMPNKSNQAEYVDFFHDKIQRAFLSEITTPILENCINLFVQSNPRPIVKEGRRAKFAGGLAPAGVEQSGVIKWPMHAMGQIFKEPKKAPAFDPAFLEHWQQTYGSTLDNPIDRFGIDLSDRQFKVMEGILKGLSQTRYEGNREPIEKKEIMEEHFPNITDVDKLPKMYKNVAKIPCIKVNQRELLRLCGIDENDQAEYRRGMDALQTLCFTQFCFFYTRLAIDSNGKAIRDKSGDWRKEEVEAVDTLFKLNIVRDKVTGEFSYYEISPSALYLDQHDKYFLLMPAGWRHQIRKAVGEAKASSYTMLFLLYLRYMFELMRRKARRTKATSPYTLCTSWVDIAIALRMPESVYKGKKARAMKLIEQAYYVAKKTGYLSDYTWGNEKDVLTLNPAAYHSPKEIEA